MNAMSTTLRKLAEDRPVFHSEADFQHALAWKIHCSCPDAAIRLEKRIDETGQPVYLDMVSSKDSGHTAVELKYKTKRLDVECKGESFHLLEQGAQDHGRYDFIADIRRLEDYVRNGDKRVGYAIFLTNDRGYWTPPRSEDTQDAEFRVHEGRSLSGTVQWREGTPKGTMGKRETPIELIGSYNLEWNDYSTPASQCENAFRYLSVKVQNSAN